jgi:hypothetical protein
MAKKKKKDQELRMTEGELYAARCFQAEGELAALQAHMVAAKRREVLRELDPEGRLEALDIKAKDLLGKASSSKGKFAEVMDRVAIRIGCKTSEIAWDDETGEVKILGED